MQPDEPLGSAREFVADLQRDLGDDVVTAAVLFGSAARGEWVPGVSDINVLVLVREVKASLLAAASAACSRWTPHGVVPLLMAGPEWQRAYDVFGIELEDMRQAHVPLFGRDPAPDTPIDSTALRLQAEREIRSKLLHLHGALVLAAADPLAVGQLLRHSLPAFLTYLRVALRLERQTVPDTSSQVIAAGCARIGASPDAFARVLEERGNTRWAVDIRDPIVDQYNITAERLAAFIDTLGT